MQVTEAVPTGLSGRVLRLATADSYPNLPLDAVKAIAVAGIQAPGRRPFLVIDLLMQVPPAGSEPLRLIRMLSSGFDPRPLVGGNATAAEAYQGLLVRLLDLSQATPLPDHDSARGRPYRMFGSLAQYEAEVLCSK